MRPWIPHAKFQTCSLLMLNIKSTIFRKAKSRTKKFQGHKYAFIAQKKYRKNRKIDFSFVSAHCASFMKVWPFLKGEGVCISLLGKGPAQITLSRFVFRLTKSNARCTREDLLRCYSRMMQGQNAWTLTVDSESACVLKLHFASEYNFMRAVWEISWSIEIGF